MKRILLAVCLLAPTFFSNAQKEISLQDIWASPAFYGDRLGGLRSMNDGLYYTTMEEDRGFTTIQKWSYKTGKEEGKIFSTSEIKTDGAPLKVEGYQFSADEKKLLLRTETENIFRYSTRESNYVFDLKSKKLTPLETEAKQRYATFSPTGNQVAFVRNNNLFVKDVEKNELVQVTKDGEKNKIINGATDWVYEEEFAFDKAFFWSPKGNKIAYYKFDESGVREFNMPKYGGLYPEDVRFKYPKAGEENAKVKIFIYDLSSGKSVEAKVGEYEYIPRVKWSNSEDGLCVTTMNRLQNELNLFMVNSKTGEGKSFFQEQSDTYIEVNNFLTFVGDDQYIWLSERSGYNHLYLRNLKPSTPSTAIQLTSGNWEVTDVYGFEKKGGMIYFQAAKESPLQREIYRVSIKGGEPQKLSIKPGTNRAVFSKSFKYFINYVSSLNEPSFVSLHQADGKSIRTLIDNEPLKKRVKAFEISPAQFFTVKTEAGDLGAWMIKPKDFDAKKKYPVLMYVYGGPGSQTVKDSWGGPNYFWYQMLASKGYIVVSVDNRGTGARGYNFRTATYRQLGRLESQDQIDAAKFLGGLDYVDADRIGIWGWSYGGYMSSLCLFKGADVFKTAIAVAPVTNWKFYDSIYTERYMATPQENSGYEENSPISHVGKLEGNLLLVHGTGDDNVHFQNSVEMVSALQNAGKQFDLMMYPNKTHGIGGGGTRLHLYTMMTEFLLENL